MDSRIADLSMRSNHISEYEIRPNWPDRRLVIEIDLLDEEASQDYDNWNNKWTGLDLCFPSTLES